MIPIILDCDPGHDDVMAIIMALGHKKIDLLGIVTSAGNTTLDNTTHNALFTLQTLDRKDIPVCRGLDKPFIRDLELGDIVHGKSGLDGIDFPKLEIKDVDENYIDFMARLVMGSKDKVTLVVTGPDTNTASFLLARPDLKDRIERIVVMGGAIYGGNWSTSAEFNIWEDAESTTVLLESGIEVTFCTLEATNKARVSKNQINEYRMLGGKAGILMADMCDYFWHKYGYEDDDEKVEVPMHDALTIATLLDDDCVKLRPAKVHIDLESDYSFGCTICDFDSKDCNARVSINLDFDRFNELMKEAIVNLR